LRRDMAKETEKQLSAIKEDMDTIQKNQADSKVQLDKVSQEVSIANNRLDDYRDRLDKLEQRIASSEQTMTQKLDVTKTEIQHRVDALEQKINSSMAENSTLTVPIPTNTTGSSTASTPVE